MIDYKVIVDVWISDLSFNRELILTIEEDISIEDDFERSELIRDILLEKAKEDLHHNNIELIEYEELTDRDYDIYKLTY
jgi:hypothetical protein